jgi:hypothetical protein
LAIEGCHPEPAAGGEGPYVCFRLDAAHRAILSIVNHQSKAVILSLPQAAKDLTSACAAMLLTGPFFQSSIVNEQIVNL